MTRTPMMPFVHLHLHSAFSPMRGVSSITALAAAVRAQGGATVALTDTNGLYGAVRFLNVARETGLQPILGTELTTKLHRAVLLAKTPEGYSNLCRILSVRHCEPSFGFIETVARHRTGLILLTDDEPALSAWSRDSREDLYVELTPGPGMHHSLLASRRMNLPPVATNRVHFIRPDEFTVHRLLRTIALNTTLSRLPSEACCSPTQWLMPPSAMSAHFPHVPDALENTVRIADACHTDWSFRDTIFPAFRQLSDEAACTLLREKTYEGARQRYGTISPEIRQRVEHELSLISQKGFASYFLVVEEIVQQAPRTCGRGSVAASIVSYCLTITHVDPLRHNLFFERFLNPGRQGSAGYRHRLPLGRAGSRFRLGVSSLWRASGGHGRQPEYPGSSRRHP